VIVQERSRYQAGLSPCAETRRPRGAGRGGSTAPAPRHRFAGDHEAAGPAAGPRAD